jgi:hypothetical protein
MITVSSLFKNNLAVYTLALNNSAYRIFVYKGTKPTNIQATPYSITTQAANQLLSFTLSNSTFQVFGGTVAFQTAPAAATASASGTASWAAVCNSFSGTPTVAIIGDVSLNNGTGMLFLPTLTIVSGTSYSILECSWTFV